MAGRSFEEQVREEMDGLRIRPDDSVWQNLETVLGQKKKKRWVIWLFFTGLGLFCLSSVWYVITQNKMQVTGQPAITTAPGNSSGGSPEKKVVKKDNVTEEDNHMPLPVLKGRQAFALPDKNGEPVQMPDSDEKLAKEVSGSDPGRSDKKQTVAVISSTEQGKDPDKKQSGQTVSEELNQNKTELSRLVQQVDIEIKKDTGSESPQLPLQELHHTDSGNLGGEIKKSSGKIPLKYSWQFSLAAHAGQSGMRKEIGRSLMNQNVLSSVIPPFSMPGGNNNFRVPSLQDAASFGFSAELSKQLSKRAGISFAFGYNLYQTRIGVGRKIDSVVLGNMVGQAVNNGYFISSDSVAYQNRFHFLQAEIAGFLQYPLTKTVSLRWSAGAGAALLLGSNALQYNETQGILYANNSLLNKLQWNLSTNLEFGFGKQPLIYVGPQLNWFVTSPYKTTVSADQHLFRLAVKARVVLTKKRK